MYRGQNNLSFQYKYSKNEDADANLGNVFKYFWDSSLEWSQLGYSRYLLEYEGKSKWSENNVLVSIFIFGAFCDWLGSLL